MRFQGEIDWDFKGEGPLWAYHLHQFDWARCPEPSPQDRLGAMLDWVERHPRGIGWDAGPISLRTFSWIKLLTTPGALPDDPTSRAAICASLASQLATLERNLEIHLLANHYLWNLLALVLAGVAFEGEEATDGSPTSRLSAISSKSRCSPMEHTTSAVPCTTRCCSRICSIW